MLVLPDPLFPISNTFATEWKKHKNLRLKTRTISIKANANGSASGHLPFSSCSYFLFAADWRNQIRFGVFSATPTPTTHVNQQIFLRQFFDALVRLCTYRQKKKKIQFDFSSQSNVICIRFFFSSNFLFSWIIFDRKTVVIRCVSAHDRHESRHESTEGAFGWIHSQWPSMWMIHSNGREAEEEEGDDRKAFLCIRIDGAATRFTHTLCLFNKFLMHVARSSLELHAISW